MTADYLVRDGEPTTKASAVSTTAAMLKMLNRISILFSFPQSRAPAGGAVPQGTDTPPYRTSVLISSESPAP